MIHVFFAAQAASMLYPLMHTNIAFWRKNYRHNQNDYPIKGVSNEPLFLPPRAGFCVRDRVADDLAGEGGTKLFHPCRAIEGRLACTT
jgi:hypothetical protein